RPAVFLATREHLDFELAPPRLAFVGGEAAHRFRARPPFAAGTVTRPRVGPSGSRSLPPSRVHTIPRPRRLSRRWPLALIDRARRPRVRGRRILDAIDWRAVPGRGIPRRLLAARA